MSLQDPTAKMSKSDPNARATVFLSDNEDQIVKKVKSAVTDTGTEVSYDWDEKPGISNLLEIFAYFSNRSIDELVEEYREGGYGKFKLAVAEAVAAGIEPIRETYEGMSDAEVAAFMTEAAERARSMADDTMRDVREAVGLV